MEITLNLPEFDINSLIVVTGMEIVRSYTVVLPSLQLESQDKRLQEGRVFFLMIKIYTQGALTPWIGTLKQGKKQI